MLMLFGKYPLLSERDYMISIEYQPDKGQGLLFLDASSN